MEAEVHVYMPVMPEKQFLECFKNKCLQNSGLKILQMLFTFQALQVSNLLLSVTFR